MANVDVQYMKGTTGGLIRKMVEVVPSDDPNAGGFGPNGALYSDPPKNKKPIFAVGLRVEKQGYVSFVDVDGDVVTVLMGELDELTCLVHKVLAAETTSGQTIGDEGKIFGMLI